MNDDAAPICPCCNKPVPSDKIEVFRRNMARYADSPDPAHAELRQLARRSSDIEDGYILFNPGEA